MRARVDEDIVRHLWWLRPVLNEPAPEAGVAGVGRSALTFSAGESSEAVGALAGAGARSSRQSAGPFAPKPARTGGDDVVKTVRHDGPKVGRNDPCPCGSGKKYKKCHGASVT
jgi:preprotein translocase subunit SecA